MGGEQETDAESESPKDLDDASDWWDREFVTHAHDMRRRIAVYTFRLAVCFVVASFLPWPIQPIGLAFSLALLVFAFIRVAGSLPILC